MIANVMLAATRRAGVRVARLHRPYTTAMAFRDGAPGSVTSQALTANELRDFERDGYEAQLAWVLRLLVFADRPM